MLKTVETVPVPEPPYLHRLLRSVTSAYSRFWQQPQAHQLISFVFIAQALIFLATVVYALLSSFDTAIGLDGS